MRGGDFDLQLGTDVSIGYTNHDADTVQLYLPGDADLPGVHRRGIGRVDVIAYPAKPDLALTLRVVETTLSRTGIGCAAGVLAASWVSPVRNSKQSVNDTDLSGSIHGAISRPSRQPATHCCGTACVGVVGILSFVVLVETVFNLG
jgi:hypothetical protein